MDPTAGAEDPIPPWTRASSSASILFSVASGSLRPPVAKNLMPLSAKGLWLAEIMAAGQSRAWAR
jgi:hypothetical protein